MRKRDRATIKKPNGVIYFITYILIYPTLKVLFRLKVDRRDYRPPKRPFVVISNHQSFMDFLIVMLSIYPQRLNAVAALKFFFYRPLHVLLPIMGCIPKSLFDPDVRSIVGVMSVVKKGYNLLLFPEGRCSTDGTYAGMHKATGKLLKKLAVPVVSCHVEGAYVCMPFWRGGIRPGVARVTIANLFTAEEMKTLSVDEINQRIDRRLSGADTPPPKRPFRVAAPRRLCEGLENILYYCPNCQGLYTLETKKSSLRCTACGTVAKMKRDARIVTKQGPAFPETVQLWFKLQVERELTFMQGEMEPLVIAVIVRMSLSPGNGMEPCGEGVLRLDSSGWRYEGDLKGEKVALFFPIDTVPAIPFDPYYNIQIYAGGDMYMFVPKENLKACVQYAIIGECAYRRYAVNMQMTQGECFPDVENMKGRQTGELRSPVS